MINTILNRFIQAHTTPRATVVWRYSTNTQRHNCKDNKLTWPNQIDFILFHLRNIPNRVTGISSWKFVNGRTMSHLLDTLKVYSEESHSPSLNVSDYLALHQERLNIIWDGVRENVKQVKSERGLQKKRNI